MRHHFQQGGGPASLRLGQSNRRAALLLSASPPPPVERTGAEWTGTSTFEQFVCSPLKATLQGSPSEPRRWGGLEKSSFRGASNASETSSSARHRSAWAWNGLCMTTLPALQVLSCGNDPPPPWGDTPYALTPGLPRPLVVTPL